MDKSRGLTYNFHTIYLIYLQKILRKVFKQFQYFKTYFTEQIPKWQYCTKDKRGCGEYRRKYRF